MSNPLYPRSNVVILKRNHQKSSTWHGRKFMTYISAGRAHTAGCVKTSPVCTIARRWMSRKCPARALWNRAQPQRATSSGNQAPSLVGDTKGIDRRATRTTTEMASPGRYKGTGAWRTSFRTATWTVCAATPSLQAGTDPQSAGSSHRQNYPAGTEHRSSHPENEPSDPTNHPSRTGSYPSRAAGRPSHRKSHSPRPEYDSSRRNITHPGQKVTRPARKSFLPVRRRLVPGLSSQAPKLFSPKAGL